jgi:hypothetical protein
MTVLGIDPGPTQSAYVLFNGTQPLDAGIIANEAMLAKMDEFFGADHCAIEKVASFGMPVGEEVFETVHWGGRFTERWEATHAHLCGVGQAARIRRIDIKTHLCKNSRANDTHIRQALIDRFGPGKPKAIGTKAAPGPLYDIHADEWAALAVAVTHYDALALKVN